MPTRRIAVFAAVMGTLLASCGLDQGVVSVSAGPTPVESTSPNGDTAAVVTDSIDPADAADDGSAIADEPEPTTPTTSEPVATLPPVIEPELTADIALGDVVDIDDGKPARAHDSFVAVAFTDIQRWWGEVFPEVYGESFEPLEGGVYAGYPERTTPIPGCGEPRTAYADLQLYVAFYCEFGDFMAYDDGDVGDSILTPLADEYGSAVLGVVLAHEYGHAIQGRIGALDQQLATIITEQQADCFAGAWTGQAYRGESPLLRLGDSDVRAGLLAMLSVRDPVGTNQFVPGGHGSAFDRVGAFQEGFLNGPERCGALLDDPLPLMPNEFRTSEDLLRGGDAPYSCQGVADPNCSAATDFLADDLNHFWQTALGAEFAEVTAIGASDLSAVSCGAIDQLAAAVAVCRDERIVAYDEPAVLDLYGEFGDFTLGYFYGIGWAEFVQDQLDSPLTGEKRALLDDCFTGAWVRDITPDAAGNTPRQGDRDGDGIPETVESSPGDLDEAIQMAILVGDRGANVDRVGSPFEKIDAFRTGVLGGLTACEALLAG